MGNGQNGSELFGKKIVPHHLLNFSEQIYDILVAEIELGRWAVNDRLPGVMSLARQLGFGTKTVQVAYDKLKQDGYVNTLGYRGTYLKSRHPQAPGINGKIGVLISQDQVAQPLILWYEHVILMWARRKNMLTEVKVLPEDIPAGEIHRKGVVFGEDFDGIISLSAFRMPVRFDADDNFLPLVFLCPPYERCAPKVCADVRDAYYDLTSRLIRSGHTQIVFSEDSVEPDARQTRMQWEGYLEAMEENALEVNTEILEASRLVSNTDLSSVTTHLKSLAALKGRRRPTAVVAGSLGRAMVLARSAPHVNIDVPEDLSIVTIGSDHLDAKTGRQISGMLPDFDHMAEMCLTVIDQQRKSGKSDFTEIHVRMHFLPGDTIRSLGENQSPGRISHASPARIRPQRQAGKLSPVMVGFT